MSSFISSFRDITHVLPSRSVCTEPLEEPFQFLPLSPLSVLAAQESALLVLTFTSGSFAHGVGFARQRIPVTTAARDPAARRRASGASFNLRSALVRSLTASSHHHVQPSIFSSLPPPPPPPPALACLRQDVSFNCSV